MLSPFVVVTAKNFFRVSYRTEGQLQSHCFQASDTFNKQQWVNCIRQAKEAAALAGDQLSAPGQCLQMDLGGEKRPVRRSCCDLRQEECEGVGWVETDSGQAGASLSGERDEGVGEELLADGGAGPGTRRDEEATPVAGGETEHEALDQGVRVWEVGERDGDADVSASSCQEEEERGEMEKEQSGAVVEEEVSMETGEEDALRC